MEGDLLLVWTWSKASSSSGLFFSREGPAEELADALEAIEMPVVLWHVARCTGAEDLVGAAEDFVGGAEDFEGGGAI